MNAEPEVKNEEVEQPRELDLIIDVDEVNNSDPFAENQKDNQEIEQEEQEKVKNKVVGSLELTSQMTDPNLDKKVNLKRQKK